MDTYKPECGHESQFPSKSTFLLVSGCCSGALTVANLRRLNINFTSQCETRVNNISVEVRTMLWTARQLLPALFGCQSYTMRLDSAKIQNSACSFRWNFAKVIYMRHFCWSLQLQRTVSVFRHDFNLEVRIGFKVRRRVMHYVYEHLQKERNTMCACVCIVQNYHNHMASSMHFYTGRYTVISFCDNR